MVRTPSPRAAVNYGMPRTLAATLAALLLLAVWPSASGPVERQTARRWEQWAWIEPAPFDAGAAESLLTAYDTGRYVDFDRLLDPLRASVINPYEFEVGAERWITAGADRRRRGFVAAAVALELAAAQRPRRQVPASALEEATVTEVRFVLAELGCAWLREHPPSMAEQAWHTAFVALARITDREDQIIPLPVPPAKAEGVYREIVARFQQHATHTSRPSRIDAARRPDAHGVHLRARFPDNPFPAFLEATVRERDQAMYPETLLDGSSDPAWIDASDVRRIAETGERRVRALPTNLRMDRPSAERLLRVAPEREETRIGYSVIPIVGPRRQSAAFTSLALWDVVDRLHMVATREPVAAEASLRLGQNYVRLARPDLALPALGRAESLATTPYERYLARLFAGAVFARTGRRTEAITALRGALEAVPRAQAASFALAPLLLELDARADAAEILEAATTLPLADDPLQSYYEGDPAAISRSLVQLREAAKQ